MAKLWKAYFMYFTYNNRSTYKEPYYETAEDNIDFIKKIKFDDGGELALVYNKGSCDDGYDDDGEYNSDEDDSVNLNDNTFVFHGYNILLEGPNGDTCRWYENDFGEDGLSPKMLDFFQQLYKTMSLGTSVS